MTENPLYAELEVEATELLAEYGTSMILKRETAATIDPVTNVVTPGGSAELDCTGIATGYALTLIDGSRIKTGDKRVVLTAKHEPLLSDKLIVNGESWVIVDIDTKQPAQTVLVYILQVRR